MSSVLKLLWNFLFEHHTTEQASCAVHWPCTAHGASTDDAIRLKDDCHSSEREGELRSLSAALVGREHRPVLWLRWPASVPSRARERAGSRSQRTQHMCHTSAYLLSRNMLVPQRHGQRSGK